MEAMLTCGNWTQTLGCVGKVRLGGGGVSSDKTVFGAHNGLRRNSSAGLSSVAKELRVVSSFRRRQAANVGAGDLSVRAASGNGAAPKQFDYDVVIIGAGVGGHGAALHAVEKVRWFDPDFALFVGCLSLCHIPCCCCTNGRGIQRGIGA